MRLHERRLIRRARYVATLLVALTLVAMVWTVLRNGTRGTSASSQESSSSSTSPSSSGSSAQ